MGVLHSGGAGGLWCRGWILCTSPLRAGCEEGQSGQAPAQVLVTSVPLTKPSDCPQDTYTALPPSQPAEMGKRDPLGRQPLRPSLHLPQPLESCGSQVSSLVESREYKAGTQRHSETYRISVEICRHSLQMYKSRAHLLPPHRYTVQIAASVKAGGGGQRKTCRWRGRGKGVLGPMLGLPAAGHLGHHWVMGHDILLRHSQSTESIPQKYGPFTSPGRELTLRGQPFCPC